MTKWLKPYFCKLKKRQCIRRSATCSQVDWPNSFWDMTKCLKPYFCKLKKQQCIRCSATCWAQRVDTQVDWPNSFWDMTNKTLFLQIEETTIRRSATCWAQSGRLANSFWDMTKCLKPYFCKLKKQQCIRRSATWPEHNALTLQQVDWPNSFWDMTKCLKPYFCTLKKQQCIRRSATCWAQRVVLRSIGQIVSELTKCLKTNRKIGPSVFGAALPAEHNALTLRWIGQIVSEIWQNV